ncbi:hypothetical protein HQ535_02485 [bacterium]|nr:hypothetical protein [bacterium]
MRRLRSALTLLTVAVLALALAAPALAKGKPGVTTIQIGELLASTGETLTVGFDEFGYNYQGHMFSGRYCDYNRVIGGSYCDVKLIMKWNDAWLANTDADYDKLLDRHFGFDSYIGSGAWTTNHQSGEYEGEDGKTCKWNYFVKIVAAPADAYKVPSNANGSTIPGLWYTVDDTEIGAVIWGAFAIIQEVENDRCAGVHGIQYLSPNNAGFGSYMP